MEEDDVDMQETGTPNSTGTAATTDWEEENLTHEVGSQENNIDLLLKSLGNYTRSMNDSVISENACKITICALKAIITTSSLKKPGGLLLTRAQRLQTEDLFKTLAVLRALGCMNNLQLRDKIIELDDIPLEVLWWLHNSHFVLLSTWIYKNLGRLDRVDLFEQRMMELVYDRTELMEEPFNGDEYCDYTLYYRIIRDLMTNIVVTSQLPKLKCSFICAEMLKNIISQFLEKITSPLTQQPPCNFLMLMLTNNYGLIAPDNLEQLCAGMLQDLLSQESSCDMYTALSMQTEWVKCKTSPHLVDFLCNLCEYLSPERTAKLLENAVKLKKKHWYFIMTITSTIVSTSCGLDLIKGLKDKIFQEALYRADAEILAVAFLLARQCSFQMHQSDPQCQSVDAYSYYSSWFIKTLSGKLTSFNFKVIYNSLIDWVPFEPAAILQVHLGWTPSVTIEIRFKLRLYASKARDRLSDLNIDVTPSILGKLNGQCDIDLVLDHFATKGEILPALLGAATIHRGNYEKHFLPRLLARKHKKIVAALMTLKKIPKRHHKKASDICKS